MLASAVNKQLGALREANGKKKKEMATIVGKSLASWNNYEKGVGNIPDAVIEALCKYFSLTQEDLLAYTASLEEQAPVQEKTEAVEQAPVVEEAPAVQEAVQGEAPAVEEAVQEEAPAKEEAPLPTTIGMPKPSGPQLIIQSSWGQEVTIDHLLAICPIAEKIYVKPDENRAYWTKGQAAGSVVIWE